MTEKTMDQHVASPRARDVLRAIAGVIDMSDPDHPTFADSAADCLDELLRHEADIRALLEQAGGARCDTCGRGAGSCARLHIGFA